MKKAILNSIISRISEEFGGQKTELFFETEFQLLVAVILSAQATDKQVNIVTRSLFQSIRQPEDVIILGLGHLETSIKSLNYFRTKAKHIFATSQMLVSDFDSQIPDTLEACMKLPGVGIKTAKVVLGVLFDAPYVGVDTHIHRVCNRIGIVHTSSPQETDAYLEKHLSIEQKRAIHHPMVLFGRYQCSAIKPKCDTCKIQPLCKFGKKGMYP